MLTVNSHANFCVFGPPYSFGMGKIGDRVRAMRKAKQLSQAELAKRIGITQPSLSLIESGQTASLAGTTLDGLCRELGTTTEYILHGTMQPDPEVTKLQGELIRILNLLPPEARPALLGAARGILDAQVSEQQRKPNTKH